MQSEIRIYKSILLLLFHNIVKVFINTLKNAYFCLIYIIIVVSSVLVKISTIYIHYLYNNISGYQLPTEKIIVGIQSFTAHVQL